MKHNGDYRTRTDLMDEHPANDAGQIVCFVIFAVCWILDSFVFRLSVGPLEIVPLAVKLSLAIPVWAFAVYIGLTSHTIVFKEVRNPPAVITKGVFSWIRHPLYAAGLLFYTGLFLATGSLCSLVILMPIFFFINHMAAFEEKKLEEKFGDAYRSYKKKTGRWFPKLYKKT
ncbi:MAG: isoprenylcysteine carboxylmethyltransferase family protein [Spirochaetales bacterium]|nr:isoprenylcysteine carboxylmethyltransferase family protein [Spirochaetales bacterium]